ncbi:MAG: hypothetical protein ACI9G1_004587 [Pirellulaceae bacterium]|jgi:hypothetical protein
MPQSRKRRGKKLDKTAFVFLMYNFAYAPDVTGIQGVASLDLGQLAL